MPQTLLCVSVASSLRIHGKKKAHVDVPFASLPKAHLLHRAHHRPPPPTSRHCFRLTKPRTLRLHLSGGFATFPWWSPRPRRRPGTCEGSALHVTPAPWPSSCSSRGFSPSTPSFQYSLALYIPPSMKPVDIDLRAYVLQSSIALSKLANTSHGRISHTALQHSRLCDSHRSSFPCLAAV